MAAGSGQSVRFRVGRLSTPELEPLIVTNVQPTGREIGAGAYGSVVEVEIPGAQVAAKKLHDSLVQFGSAQQVHKWISDFVDECKLMSLLRHPHIVQFLGVCYLQGSRLPVLLMEKLSTSLDDILEKHKEIPLDVKFSILVDVSRGLVYLHCHIPSIAHRDLTARNILLDLALTAKIADLGVARMVNLRPGQVAATMTRAPGNIIYMPPEAVEEEGAARYNTAIDMFSFGNVALFTLTQVFMKNLKPATYRDPTTRKIVGRTEIERREEYIQLMYRDLGEYHPLVQVVLQCLEYDQVDRPSAVEVLQRLEETGNVIPQNCRETKLELIRQIAGMQREKEVAIQEVRRQYERHFTDREHQIEESKAQINFLQADVAEKQEQVHSLEQVTMLQQQQLETQRVEIETQHVAIETQRVVFETKNAENEALRQENRTRSAEVNELSGRLRSLELQRRRPQLLEKGVDRPHVLGQRDVEKPLTKPKSRGTWFRSLRKKKHPRQTTTPTSTPTSCTSTPTSISLNWRRSKDIPQTISVCGLPVVLDGKVYVGGLSWGTTCTTVYAYTPDRDTRIWDILPSPPVDSFTIATLKDQLVLVGGMDKSTRKVSNTITIWDSRIRQWVQPYPPMPTAREVPATVGYGEHLIVAGGYNSEDNALLDVNILNTTNSGWLTAELLPSTDLYRSALIGDTLYLVGNNTRVVLRAHVPTLISHASSAIPTSSQCVWESLPNAPFYRSSPVAIDNMLLTVGGSTNSNCSNPDPMTSIQLYNPTKNEWTSIGDLPEAICGCPCTELSGELLILGGWNGPFKSANKICSVYAAKVCEIAVLCH